MRPYPVRLPESLIDELDDEATDRGLGTAEYIRRILRQRDTTQPHTNDYTQRIAATEQRLDDLEARLSALLADKHRHADEAATQAARHDDLPSAKQKPAQRSLSGSERYPDAGGASSVDVSADSLRAEAEEAAAAVSIKGRSETLVEARREALLWAWEYLREHQRAQSSEIANAVFDEFDDLGYSAQDKYRGRGVWQGYLREALRELPRVDGPDPRGRTWEFVDNGD